MASTGDRQIRRNRLVSLDKTMILHKFGNSSFMNFKNPITLMVLSIK